MAITKQINRDKFYGFIKCSFFSKGLSQKQVDSINVILDKWEASALTDRRFLAYMLATAYHETGNTMLPIEEYGKGRGLDYGKKLKMGGGKNKRIAYTKPNKLYYGRGYVQLTWYENYELMGRLLGVDLLNKPELALEPKVAVDIMFEGMLKAASSFGDFTGRSLEQYFNSKVDDPLNARRIINGTDKAELIRDYYIKFLEALK